MLYDDTSSWEDHLYEKTLIYGGSVLISNQVHRSNDTTLTQSLLLTDHEGYFHNIWQSISFNETHWHQTFYYDADEIVSIM